MVNEFRNLVFEGGGVKGIAYGGALEELNGMNILPKIKRVAGTSAGAINALLLALGYEVNEVSKIVAKTNFREFEDNPFPKWWMIRKIVRDIRKLLKKYGWHRGYVFTEWLSEKINRKIGNPDITFAQFKTLVDADREKPDEEQMGLKELSVIGTNLSQKAVVIYSHEHTPDIKINDAIRISMSIPLFFEAQFNKQGDVLVDGGVTYNYAVNIFDNKKYLDKEENGEDFDYDDTPGFKFNHETLGFRLDSTKTIEYIKKKKGLPPKPIVKFKDYVLETLDYLMESANRRHLHSNDWNRTVFIDTLDVGTTDFDLPQEKIEELITSGREGVRKHFEWRNNSGINKPV